MREAAEDHPQLAELRDRPVEKQKKKSKQGLKHVADMRVFTNGLGEALRSRFSGPQGSSGRFRNLQEEACRLGWISARAKQAI